MGEITLTIVLTLKRNKKEGGKLLREEKKIQSREENIGVISSERPRKRSGGYP